MNQSSSPPPSAADTDGLLDDYPDAGLGNPSFPRQPGRQGHNAGIAPGWKHLLTEDNLITLKQQRTAVRRLENAVRRAIVELGRRLESVERRLDRTGGRDVTR